MITCTRLIEFDAAHRVLGHESKCANLHGHRYKLEITAQAPELDTLGRVVDFSVLKERIGGWVDEVWDHTTIVYVEDSTYWDALEKLRPQKPIYVSAWNPTAENIALHILKVVCPKFLADTGIQVIKVVCWETPNCYATATL